VRDPFLCDRVSPTDGLPPLAIDILTHGQS